MSRYYTHADERRLALLRQEHSQLAYGNPGAYALCELFSDSSLDILEYCRDFRPSPYAEGSDAKVKAFAQRHSIWVEQGGDHYNSMNAYLHPAADFDRLTAMGIIYTVLFFMNDTIGREKLGHMSDTQRAEVRRIVERLDYLIDTGTLSAEAGPIERAAKASLKEIYRLADSRWYQQFLLILKQHLEPAFFDQNSRAQGKVLSVDEYIERRLHISGMYVTIALMEFGDNQYISWRDAQRYGMEHDLARLQWLCAAIGAFMNDMFSFEKEFIVDGSDFNLMPIVALNNPEFTLDEVILETARIVREMVIEFRDIAVSLEADCRILARSNPQFAKAIQAHIASLTYSVQATWVWEIVTDRYRQPYTLFTENLPQPLSM